MRQADNSLGADDELREVPRHCNHTVLWLSDDIHNACARRFHAKSGLMDHDQCTAPIAVFPNHKLMKANGATRSFLGEAWKRHYFVSQWLTRKSSSTSTGL